MKRIVFYNLLLIIGLLVYSCQPNYSKVGVETKNLPVSIDLAEEDSLLSAFIQPYKDSLHKDMSRVIGVSEIEMVKDKPEGLLSNFMADLLLEEGVAFCKKNHPEMAPAIAYVNYGGMRSSLPKGQITVRNIFELMPFENEMVFVKLGKKGVEEFINKLASHGGDGVAGARFGINDGKAINIKVAGETIKEGKHYWVVTNDYVASGGDSMEVFKTGRKGFFASRLKVRDIIIGHIEKVQENGEAITSKLDGRIYYE